MIQIIVRFDGPGASVVKIHTTEVHSWGQAVLIYDPDSDRAHNRDPNEVTAIACADVIIQMIDASSFDGYHCGSCPVACADRVIKDYRNSRPDCRIREFSIAMFCFWALRQIDARAVGIRQYQNNLLEFDFPDLMNGAPGKIPNRKSSLRE